MAKFPWLNLHEFPQHSGQKTKQSNNNNKNKKAYKWILLENRTSRPGALGETASHVDTEFQFSNIHIVSGEIFARE